MDVFEDEDDDGLDTLVKSIVDNKKSNHSRTNQTTYAEKARAKISQNVPNVKASKAPPTDDIATANDKASKGTTPKEGIPTDKTQTEEPMKHKENVRQSGNFCYFFSNFGKCDFEEKTG